jgi:hypothetical protein
MFRVISPILPSLIVEERARAADSLSLSFSSLFLLLSMIKTIDPACKTFFADQKSFDEFTDYSDSDEETDLFWTEERFCHRLLEFQFQLRDAVVDARHLGR